MRTKTLWSKPPDVLMDTSGEGIYVLAGDDEPIGRPLLRAQEILEIHRIDMDINAVAFLPPRRGERDPLNWRPVSFRSWKWMLPRFRPAVYLYCRPKGDEPDRP